MRRNWTYAEKKTLLDERANGTTYETIGKMLGRAASACLHQHRELTVRRDGSSSIPTPEPERFTTGEYLEALRNPNLLDLRRLPQITFRYGEEHGNGNT